jgi:hypothetical protein
MYISYLESERCSLVQKGDLVKWYELYNDDIVKDVGAGIILETKWWRHDEQPERGPRYSSTIVHTIHRVYKFKTNNDNWFSENDLELLSEKK